jgi:hypothetical protein
MQLLGSYHFRFAVRNYILDAFGLIFTLENLKELEEAHSGSLVEAVGDQPDSTDEKVGDDPEQRQLDKAEDKEPDIPKPKLHPKVVFVGGFQEI